MSSHLSRQHSTTAEIHAEIKDRFGVLPNFFRLTSHAPAITENLWGFARSGYLDNPLPSKFKERLFVYLSRFCEVRYCIARHIGFLAGLGRPSGDAQSSPDTAEQVVRLVRRPLPRGDDLDPLLAILEAGRAPPIRLPDSDSPEEEAIFACATHLFLQTPDAGRCLDALGRIFDPAMYQYLLLFLTFVRTAHFWTRLHPELQLEDDVTGLLAVHEELAESALNDPEAAASEVTQELLNELAVLRRERELWEAARSSEERFRSLVTASAQVVWTTDAEGQVVEDSPSWRAVTGQTYEEWKGTGWLNAIHPDDRQRAAAAWSEAVANKTVCRIEYRVRAADGTYRWTATRGVPVLRADGGVREWVGMNIDFTQQKQAEEERYKNEQQFKLLFDQAADGIFLADAEGRYLDMNPAGCEMLGYAREEIVSRRIVDTVAADDIPQIESELARLTGSKIAPSEWRLRRKDGSYLIGEVAGRQLPDGRLQAIVRDVTERKRTQQWEVNQRHVLELIARNAPVSAVCDSIVRMIEDQSANGMMASILLLDGDGIHLRHGAAPSLPEAYRRAVDGVAIGPKVGSCGTAAFRKKAVYVADIATDPLWTEFAELALSHGLRACWSTPFFSSAGQLLGTFAMYYPEMREPGDDDLLLVETATRTVAIAIERTHAEQALRESDQRFRNLADNIPQLAWIADAGTEGQVHWFNRSWYEYTGTTLEEMKGVGWHAVHHPEHAERVIRKFAHHVHEGLDWEDTFPLRGKDGNYRWFLSRMKCIRDESGTVVRIFGTNTDITQHREMEDELRRLTGELSEADRRKDEFLATLAHELRNPLAPLRNGLQLIQSAGGHAATVEQARAMMERQIIQLVRLVDDLMDVSRISRGRIELVREQVLLSAVVNSAVEASRPLIEESGHELTVTLPPQPVVVDADLTRLAQVIMNLLNNAAKYSDPGSRISLTVAREENEVVVSVKDTGIGIPPDQMPHIFEMFTQVDRSLARAQGGLGIGLSLVKRLVEMHGGTIEARSDGSGTGSEFVVRLPIVVQTSTHQRPGEEDQRQIESSLRILVVDDNRDGADSWAMILQVVGNDIRTAYDGQQALDIVEEFRPDVVLLDIGLPTMNGYEVCRRIRKTPWGKHIVLIAATGWGQEEDRRRSDEAGFDYHLVKPVNPAVLMNVLGSLTGNRKSG